MKKLLLNMISAEPGEILGNILILFLGILIVLGGRLGVDIPSRHEIIWIDSLGTLDAWIGWVLIWFALDATLAEGRATIFLLSKTVTPVIGAVLKNIIGEEKFETFAKRLKDSMKADEEEENGDKAH